jgi:CubicO group peptidase (beta-lactamase class C family)
MNLVKKLSIPLLSLVIFASLSPLLPAQGSAESKAANPSTDAAERARRWEANAASIALNEKDPPLRLSLAQVMETYRIPGFSIAVVDNFQVVFAKGYGVISPGSPSAVTSKTLFQAGSISKPVAATAALSLVQQGILALDENVNEKLKSWKVPDNEFTKTEKVTLRRLLSHTGGLTIHGFPGYDVDAPLPTIVQVLDGEKPANTQAVRVDIVPGTKFRYSGGGITIEQLMMTEITGKTFPILLRETVLDKIGMTDSSYEQPLPAARAVATAEGTHGDGKPVHGKWHIYPEMAAAGLWTTPTDLAHFAIETALSKQGKSNRILSEKMTREMLTPVLDDVGLGFFIDKESPGQFGHNGADEGFQALLSMNADTGKGVIIMANSDAFLGASDFLVSAVAREFGWNYKSPSNVYGRVLLIAKVKGATAALEYCDKLPKASLSVEGVDEGMLNGIGYSLLYSGQETDAIVVFRRIVELYPRSSNAYDSLGEAYMKTGQKELSIANYRRSLQLDPKNQNAMDRLKKLSESN